MTRLLPRFLWPYRLALLIVLVLVTHPGAGQPVPAQPQRGHHQQRRRQGRHRLHHPDRRRSCSLITFLLGVCSIVGVYFGSMTAMAFGRDVRSAIFRKVMGFSQKETNALRHADADHPQHQRRPAGPDGPGHGLQHHDHGPDHVRRRHHHGPARGRAAVRRLLIVIIPLVLIVIGTVAPCARCRSSAPMQKQTDRINQVMRETLSGMRVIRAFVRTDHEEKRFDEANRELTDTSLRVNRLFAMMIPFLFGDHEPLDRRRSSGSAACGSTPAECRSATCRPSCSTSC